MMEDTKSMLAYTVSASSSARTTPCFFVNKVTYTNTHVFRKEKESIHMDKFKIKEQYNTSHLLIH